MKRIIAIILAFVILVGLVGLASCNKREEEVVAPGAEATAAPQVTTTPEATAAPVSEGPTLEQLKASKPNAYIQEKIAAGMEVLVCQIGIADVEIITVTMASGVQKACDELGCTFMQTTSNVDNALMISQIENYVTMGAALIFIIPADTSVIKDAVLAAQEAGTDIIIHGDTCAYDTIVERVDVVEQGKIVGDAASAWIDQNYEASEFPVKVAVIGDVSVASQKAMTEAMVNVVSNSDNMTMGYYADSVVNAVDDGYTAAEEILTYDPDIKVFLSFNTGPAIGINNYLIAQPKYDLSKYCIVTGGTDTAFTQMLADAGNSKGALRAYISEASSSEVFIYQTVKNALLDVWSAPYEYLYENFATCEPNFHYTVATDFEKAA